MHFTWRRTTTWKLNSSDTLNCNFSATSDSPCFQRASTNTLTGSYQLHFDCDIGCDASVSASLAVRNVGSKLLHAMNPVNHTRTLTNTENYLFAVGTYKLLAFTIGAICALGFSSNVLVIVLYYKFKRLRTPTNLLLLNISISDLLMCVIGINFTFISCIKRRWVWNTATCVWDGFSNSLFGTLFSVLFYAYIISPIG